MFEAWGRFVYHRRRLVLLVAALARGRRGRVGNGCVRRAAVGRAASPPPGSQSQQASDAGHAAFGRDTADVVVLYRSPALTVR